MQLLYVLYSQTRLFSVYTHVLYTYMYYMANNKKIGNLFSMSVSNIYI